MTVTKSLKIKLAITIGFIIAISYQGCKNLTGMESNSSNQEVEFLNQLNGNGNGAGYGGKITIGKYYNVSDTDDCVLNEPGDIENSFIDSFIDVRESGDIIYYDSCNEENGLAVEESDIDILALREGILIFQEDFFEKYDEPPHLGIFNKILDLHSVFQIDSQNPNENEETLHKMTLIFREPLENPEELWLEISYYVNTTNEYGSRTLIRKEIEAVLLNETRNQNSTTYRSIYLPSLEIELLDGPDTPARLLGQDGVLKVELEGIKVETSLEHININ